MSTNGPDSLLPPLLEVTPNDHGAWVVVSSSLLIILTILVVVVTLVSRIKVLQSLSWSDTFLSFATIFAFPQAICISRAASSGLGRHRNALDEKSYQTYSKLLYTSQILAIISLACSKASVTLLIISIKPLKELLLACRVLLGVTTAWAFAAVITLAVQCDIPAPWDSTPGRCIDQRALYIGLNIGNILIDVAIVVLPFILVWNVKLSTAKRFQISSLFALRIGVPICTIIHLVTLKPYFHSAPFDKPWHALTPTIWSQVMISLSIVTACIPSLRRVLSDLQTGMMAGTVSQFFELSVSGGNTSSNHPNTHGVYGSGSRTGDSKTGYGGRSPLQTFRDTTTISQSRAEREQDSNTDLRFNFRNPKRAAAKQDAIERSDSVKNLTENAIVQTIDYEVRYETASERRHRASSSGHDASSYNSDGWGSGERVTPRK